VSTLHDRMYLDPTAVRWKDEGGDPSSSPPPPELPTDVAATSQTGVKKTHLMTLLHQALKPEPPVENPPLEKAAAASAPFVPYGVTYENGIAWVDPAELPKLLSFFASAVDLLPPAD
jgi:hypothetical protein